MDLYWINPSLAISSRPRGGDWLADEMVDLKRQGVDLVVSCLNPAEEAELGLTEEAISARESGLEFVSSAIKDRGTPANATAFEKIVMHLVEATRAGRKVAVHCRQGLGRAPLVAAAILVRSGTNPDSAWTLIADRRDRNVPDTLEQREWLGAFASRRPAALVR